MTPTVEIRGFKGVFSNADREDIDPEFLVKLKNKRPVNGKLVKTFGFGEKTDIGAPLGLPADNLVTYLNSELDGDRGYIAICINDTTKKLCCFISAYGVWNEWFSALDFTLLEDIYQKNARNPLIQESKILRILPGNVGYAIGTTEAKGLWIGYIDRKYFDELLSPVAGFYGYPTEIEKPVIEFMVEQIPGGTFNSKEPAEGEKKYYKFSNVYDGIQEGLLGKELQVDFGEKTFLELKYSIDKEFHNRRKNAMKIYRSDLKEGPYKHIQTIDYLRDLPEGTYDSDGAFSGIRSIYVPALKDFNFEDGKTYVIQIWYPPNSANINIYQPDEGLGSETFVSMIDIWGDCWNKGFALKEDDVLVVSQKYGLYAGANTVLLSEDFGDEILSGGVLIFNDWKAGEVTKAETIGGGEQTKFTSTNCGLREGDKILMFEMSVPSYNGEFIIQSNDTNYFVVNVSFVEDSTGWWNVENYRGIIDYNYKKVVHAARPVSRNSGDKAWRVFKPGTGLYFAKNKPDNKVEYTFCDNGLVGGAEHFLAGEKSIKVNGEFARIISGRLWQENPVLDPGGKNEHRDDLVSYSELNQFDVNPVGNVIQIYDRKGGSGTGIAEIFGNPVFMKKQAIISILNTKEYPEEPIRWAPIESTHNIGNIAKQGAIEVLDSLYTCSYDGIYRFSPNNLAESDMTPTEKLKVSDPIGDVYEALTLTQKEATKSEYDTNKSEILFTFGTEVWAYNIETGLWREIDSTITISFMTTDENANILIYDDNDRKIYSPEIKESVKSLIRTKTFAISDKRKEIVRYAFITYKSASELTIKLFTENEESVAWTGTLSASSVVITKTLAIRRRCKKFSVEIEDEAGKDNAEINRIALEHD